jgi:hypothetical protein
MRFALLTSAMLMMAAPAFAEGGLWQWGQMDMSHMQMMSGGKLATHVGDFVYGPDGSIVGTLDAVHGRTAVLHVSAFFAPGSERVHIPAADVVAVDGKLVIHGATFHGAM